MTDRPLPRLTEVNRPFWEYARQGELRLQKCSDCGRFFWPLSPVCPDCWSTDCTWQPASGRGTLASFVVFHRQYFEAITPPYVVAHVYLEEGCTLTANILHADRQDLQIGMPVQVTFEAVTDEITLPQFEPAPTA